MVSVELLHISLAELHKFYAEKIINEKVYEERKKSIEAQIKAQEKIARPTGRAALILAALSGVKPAAVALPIERPMCYEVIAPKQPEKK